MQNPKKITISNDLLEDLVSAMSNSGYDHQWYFDMENEEVVLVSDYSDDEELEEIIENDNGERFISIPANGTREGWEQMERFIESLEDQNQLTMNMLYNAIGGRSAFGRFKDAVYRAGLEKLWYEFKGREDRKMALDWLQSQELISGTDAEIGMQLYEDWLLKRKQQEEDIANMTAGRIVRCVYNDGHTDKITPGKTYKVIGERKDHLLVRIKDDRDKECWLPKSHFELVYD